MSSGYPSLFGWAPEVQPKPGPGHMSSGYPSLFGWAPEVQPKPMYMYKCFIIFNVFVLVDVVMMSYLLSLDTSGNWAFIAAVVVRRNPRFPYKSHVAGINRRIRWRIIVQVLEYINSEGYGVCLKTDIRRKVRLYTRQRISKSKAWISVLKRELERIANHLRDKKYWPIKHIYIDKEFIRFTDILKSIFKAESTYATKNSIILLSDVLAYTNHRKKFLIKKYSNIVEL